MGRSFGFSPKISTTVENIVEKRRLKPRYIGKGAILRLFLRGEDRQSRYFGPPRDS